MAEERENGIEINRKLLQSTQDQICVKEQRIDRLKNTKEFKKCDEVSGELRALIKEKGVIQSQLAALERKEAKSKWYKKKKSLKTESKSKLPSSDTSGKSSKKITDLFNDMKSDNGRTTPESSGSCICEDGNLPLDTSSESELHTQDSQKSELGVLSLSMKVVKIWVGFIAKRTC